MGQKWGQTNSGPRPFFLLFFFFLLDKATALPNDENINNNCSLLHVAWLYYANISFLYRDIQDKTVGTLSQRISGQLQSLYGLQTHLAGIKEYLLKVSKGKLPINHQILYQLQDVFNLLPNLNIEEFTQSFAVKTNDQLLMVYIASLIRSVIALDNLISNKLVISEAEKEGEKRKEDHKSKKTEGDDSKGGDKGKEGDGKGGDKEKEGSGDTSLGKKNSSKGTSKK